MEKELTVAIEAAKEAGRTIRHIHDSSSWTVENKADGKGPLTEADLASNDILMAALTSAFPEDGILSEETLDDKSRLNKGRVWIIDPLDGTREFTLGIPEFVVSVGLSVDNHAVLGVLYNPLTEELIAGYVGGGLQYNGSKAAVTSHDSINGARFLVSRSEYEKGWFDAYRDQAELRPMGSVAYKLGLVAAGLAEATFTTKPRNAWDLCGGVACVLAAGGGATDGSGQPYLMNTSDPLKIGVCGTNGVIHPRVLAMMQR